MTRDDLISILKTKKFDCMNDMAEYFEKCGFEYEIEDAELDALTVRFIHNADKLEFLSIFNPWHNTWRAVVQEYGDISEDEETIQLR